MDKNSYYFTTSRQRISRDDEFKSIQNYIYNYTSYLPASKKARILDIGCSEGVSLRWLVNSGYSKIVGVDPDPNAIEVAEERFRDETSVSFKCADALSYLNACPDKSFEAVIMLNVIEHIPKSEILVMMREIDRILVNGGVFIAQTGNWENPFNIGLFTRDFTHEVMYSVNSLRQLMLMTGFKASHIKVCQVRYKTTLRNLPLQISSVISGVMLKAVAFSMRVYINMTSPLIYCVVKKLDA